MKCEKCDKKLKVFNKDYLYCVDKKCPSLKEGWDRLVPKNT